MSERAFSPELAAFYERMETYIWEHPEDPERAVAAFPGWEADPARVGIYGRFIRSYADEVIEILFEESKAVVGEGWPQLLRDYYATRPGVSHEINGNGIAFAEFLGQRDGLPPWLPNLALHEWTRYTASAAPIEVPAQVEQLTANPTLEVLQLGWRISPWTKAWGEAGERPPEDPEPGEELTLIWRHPRTEFARYIAAGPKTLLVLKLAAEGIPPEAAAEAGGVPLEDVHATIADCAAWGLVLTPDAPTR